MPEGNTTHRLARRHHRYCGIYRPELVVHVHLGLYGAFTEAMLPVQPPRGQVRMRLIGSTHWTDLRGPVGAVEIVGVFLATRFCGGERHGRRIRLISGFEAAGDAPPICAG